VHHIAITVYDISSSYNAHRRFTVKVLLLPYPVSFQGMVGRVAGQGEVQLVLGLELLKRLDAVAAQPKNLRPQLVQFFFGITELVCLAGSTRGIGFGKEIEDQGVALEILQAHLSARIRR